MNKWEALRALAAARSLYGLSDRDLSVLQALVSFHPSVLLGESGAAPVVFPSNRTLCDRLNGMPCSTMRRHLAKLVASGAILRRDSPNGKRYARRTGGTPAAFGFDLSPLCDRFGEFRAAAATLAAEAGARDALRQELSLMRRDAAALAQYGADACPAPVWPALAALAEDTAKLLRRKLDLAGLRAIEARLAPALAEARTRLGARAAEEMSTSGSQTGQHIDSQKLIWKDPAGRFEASHADTPVAAPGCRETCGGGGKPAPQPPNRTASGDGRQRLAPATRHRPSEGGDLPGTAQPLACRTPIANRSTQAAGQDPSLPSLAPDFLGDTETPDAPGSNGNDLTPSARETRLPALHIAAPSGQAAARAASADLPRSALDSVSDSGHHRQYRPFAQSEDLPSADKAPALLTADATPQMSGRNQRGFRHPQPAAKAGTPAARSAVATPFVPAELTAPGISPASRLVTAAARQTALPATDPGRISGIKASPARARSGLETRLSADAARSPRSMSGTPVSVSPHYPGTVSGDAAAPVASAKSLPPFASPVRPREAGENTSRLPMLQATPPAPVMPVARSRYPAQAAAKSRQPDGHPAPLPPAPEAVSGCDATEAPKAARWAEPSAPGCVRTRNAEGRAPAGAMPRPRAITLQEVLTASPGMATYSPDPIRDWQDLARAADAIRPMLGIPQAVWNTAQDVMGPEGAAICLASILKRFASIRSHGAYLARLCERAARGELCLEKMVTSMCQPGDSAGSQL